MVSGGIFPLSPGSDGTWTEKVIYSFADGNDIVSFQSGLAIDSAGNLYGYRGSYYSSTGTEYYGASTWAIFELVPDSNGTWTEKILHNFGGGRDGAFPSSGVNDGAGRSSLRHNQCGRSSPWDSF